MQSLSALPESSRRLISSSRNVVLAYNLCDGLSLQGNACSDDHGDHIKLRTGALRNFLDAGATARKFGCRHCRCCHDTLGAANSETVCFHSHIHS